VPRISSTFKHLIISSIILTIATTTGCDPTRSISNLDASSEGLWPDFGRDVLEISVTESGVKPGMWTTLNAGLFTMGSPSSEACRELYEDQHTVTLTHSFDMMMTEVTQGEYLTVMGYNPSLFDACGKECPVERVSWHEAVGYCNKLSQGQGLPTCYSCSGSGIGISCTEAATYSGKNIYNCSGYRLPTEAEWEMAYRAGATTAYYNGDNKSLSCSSCSGKDTNANAIAWYCYNSQYKTHPVGELASNTYGLYDMAGNVLEWCHDGYQAILGTSAVIDPLGISSVDQHVVRGGGALDTPRYIRAANRAGSQSSLRSEMLGFRCARGWL
jgi:formylglycine-generating enzyme required for sulfatase activity